jgi:hypothetical protein
VRKKTLPESGITSIALTRTDVTGTNQGHASGHDFLGFQGGFTCANGTTGTAEMIYFAAVEQYMAGDNKKFRDADSFALNSIEISM